VLFYALEDQHRRIRKKNDVSLEIIFLFSENLIEEGLCRGCFILLCSSPCPIGYTHKTSGFKTSSFKTSGFKTSETSGLQNVRFTKRQVYKMSGLHNVRSSKRQVYKKTSIYILYLWLVEIRRLCCSHVCRQSDGCVLFSILEGFFAIYHHNK
jgi:hypothetical protein